MAKIYLFLVLKKENFDENSDSVSPCIMLHFVWGP